MGCGDGGARQVVEALYNLYRESANVVQSELVQDLRTTANDRQHCTRFIQSNSCANYIQQIRCLRTSFTLYSAPLSDCGRMLCLYRQDERKVKKHSFLGLRKGI